MKVYKTKNYVELEQALHLLLAPFRLNKSREFFTEVALKFVDRIVQIHNEVQGNEFSIHQT
jgi:T5orf172 domain